MIQDAFLRKDLGNRLRPRYAIGLPLLWGLTLVSIMCSFYTWHGIRQVGEKAARAKAYHERLTTKTRSKTTNALPALVFAQQPNVSTKTAIAPAPSSQEKAAIRMRLSALDFARNVDYQYGGLFQLLSLDEGSRERLKALLAKHQRLIDDAFREQRLYNGEADEPRHWPAIVRTATAVLDGELKKELGPEGFQLFDDYRETSWIRVWAQKADSMLRADGISMSMETMERIVTMIATENPERKLYPSVSNDTLHRASSFVNPQELAAMQGVAAELHGRNVLFEKAKKRLIEQRSHRESGVK